MKFEKVSYKSTDGVSLAGIVHTPPVETPKGCIILCHGLSGNKDEWNNLFVELSERLCSNNFKVIRFDFRGHGESGLNPEQMTIAGELLDLKSTINKLAKEYSKIGLLGYSFGTQASILYTVEKPGKVKSLVLWAPVLDFNVGFLTPELSWGKSFFDSGGYENLEKQGYTQVDINNFRVGKDLVQEFNRYKPYEILGNIKCPVLTIHGTKDTAVSYEVSEKHGRPNKDSQFISVVADHSLMEERERVMNETISWFINNM